MGKWSIYKNAVHSCKLGTIRQIFRKEIPTKILSENLKEESKGERFIAFRGAK